MFGFGFGPGAGDLLLKPDRYKRKGQAMAKRIIRHLGDDGIDRRGFLECMSWAGTGLLWTINGGVAHSQIAHRATEVPPGTLNFVQISDSHMGFNKPANPDVAATLQAAVDKIR